MASGEELLDRLRRTKAGWSAKDFDRLLTHYGYVSKPVNHGLLYRSGELAGHPDLEVRRKLAQVVVPRGTELRKYVGRKVEASIHALLRLREEVDQ